MNRKIFMWGGYQSTTQPQPGGPGTTLRLTHILWSYQHMWPYQDLMLPPASLSWLLFTTLSCSTKKIADYFEFPDQFVVRNFIITFNVHTWPSGNDWWLKYHAESPLQTVQHNSSYNLKISIEKTKVMDGVHREIAQ